MKSESTQNENKSLSDEVSEIWAVLTAHEKRTMDFGMYPESLVKDAAQKCGCAVEQVIDGLRAMARNTKQAAA